MTAGEARDIDGFYALDEAIPPPALDDKLLDIVLNEVKPDKPVLIYANKNGAHFPYDQDYPDQARLFHPTMSEAAQDTGASRIASFRNAVRWSVDRIMARLIEEADRPDTLIIYTSDHGQAFNPKHFTHCTVEDPDPREGLVPLFVVTGNAALRAQLVAAARASRGHGSHFAIAPTVLDLLGYSQEAVATNYGASLLRNIARAQIHDRRHLRPVHRQAALGTRSILATTIWSATRFPSRNRRPPTPHKRGRSQGVRIRPEGSR